jgi:acyl-CoA thioester hydrolase
MKTFTTRVRARYCETDAAGVIYYGSFMKYFEVGKMEMYRELGLPFNRSFPIVETLCRYPAPCYFDDLLEIHTWFDKAGRRSFRVRSAVHRVEADGTLTLVGDGYTAHVYIDDDRKPAPLPAVYLEVFQKVGLER